MPRKAMGSMEMEAAITTYFNAQTESSWTEQTIEVECVGISCDGTINLDVIYYYNQGKNTILFPGALATASNDCGVPTYQNAVQAVSIQLGYSNMNICASLIGNGSFEPHFIAMYQNATCVMLFDSQVSNDMNHFLSSLNYPTPEGLKRAALEIAPGMNHRYDSPISGTFLAKPAIMHRLNTELSSDRVSCGYHSCGAVIAMAELIDNGEVISLDTIQRKIEEEPLDMLTERLMEASASLKRGP